MGHFLSHSFEVLCFEVKRYLLNELQWEPYSAMDFRVFIDCHFVSDVRNLKRFFSIISRMKREKTYFCAIKTNSMETKQFKFYKVFLASSNELSDDRKHFFLYKDKVNKIIEKFGYQIQVERWEITDPAFPSGRGQDEYNKLLKDCDECIVLFWKKRGNFSEEELDVAFEGFKNGEKPNRLTVYFKEVEEKYVEPDLIEFKKDFLKKYGERFYASYRGIEGVESDFLLFFIGKNLPAAKLSIQDSKIMLDGQELGNVSNLSLAYNNKSYQKLSKEVLDLEKDLLSLKTSNPKSSSIPLLEKELSEKKKELQNFEKALMEMAQTITRITTADPDDKRVALAQKEFEEGNYHKTLDILNREEILADAAQCEKDFETAKALADKAKEKYRAKIETIVLRIQYLSVAKVKNWVSECKELYEKAVFHARKCYTDSELADLLFKQAYFLQDNNQFADSQCAYAEVLERYRKLAEATPETYLLDVAYSLGNLGLLHQDTGKYAEAEKEFSEILTIFRKLAEDSPEAYLPDVATTLNNLGILHSDTGKHGDAEMEYVEALEKYRKLAESSPEAYLPDVAMTLNNLGNLHSDTGKHGEAEREYGEALEIRRKLAEATPEAYLPDVANTLNNLGILHRNTGKHGDAEKEYGEALEKYRKLAESAPEAYLPYVAGTLNNLGELHRIIGNYSKAEIELAEALEIRRKLAETSPEAYLPDVAMTLNNLGNLHYNTGKHSDAEKELGEALEIYRKLAESTPEAYLPYVAGTLFNMAVFRMTQGKLSEAAQMAQESLENFQTMAKLSPAAFNKDVEDAKNLLEKIRAKQDEEE